VVNLIEAVNLNGIIKKHQADHYYKAFKAKAPAKSTACDGLRNRDSKFFEAVYFSLVSHYHGFLSDSRTFGLTFKEVLLIDSTTIRLFSDILKGVGRNPRGTARKKGG
jgi:hypothetical protein